MHAIFLRSLVHQDRFLSGRGRPYRQRGWFLCGGGGGFNGGRRGPRSRSLDNRTYFKEQNVAFRFIISSFTITSVSSCLYTYAKQLGCLMHLHRGRIYQD